jgi:hypothetical protein
MLLVVFENTVSGVRGGGSMDLFYNMQQQNIQRIWRHHPIQTRVRLLMIRSRFCIIGD